VYLHKIPAIITILKNVNIKIAHRVDSMLEALLKIIPKRYIQSE
jgi:hypothetical protein